MIDDSLIIQIQEVEKEVLDALDNGNRNMDQSINSINDALDSINSHMGFEQLSLAEQARLMVHKTELLTLRAKITGIGDENSAGNYESVVNVIKDRYK